MKKIIYLVEDNDDISDLISYLLSESGFEVQVDTTISGFKQRLTKLVPDLIILDIMLPDGNGVDTCKELRSNGATSLIPVLLMSAQTDGKLLANEVGANDFISKPFDIYDFIATVKRQFA